MRRGEGKMRRRRKIGWRGEKWMRRRGGQVVRWGYEGKKLGWPWWSAVDKWCANVKIKNEPVKSWRDKHLRRLFIHLPTLQCSWGRGKYIYSLRRVWTTYVKGYYANTFQIYCKYIAMLLRKGIYIVWERSEQCLAEVILQTYSIKVLTNKYCAHISPKYWQIYMFGTYITRCWQIYILQTYFTILLTNIYPTNIFYQSADK